MKQSVKVVRNEITADECMRRLKEFREDTGAYFAYGWTYRGGVYTVYVQAEPRFITGVADMANEVLEDIVSAGLDTCQGCEARHNCGIEPDCCSRWL